MKFLLLVSLITSFLLSSEYAVVVNTKSSIFQLTQKQVKDIFMKKRHFIDGKKVLPVNLFASSILREKFEQKVLKINRNKINRYWIKQHFQGISPPVVQSSENSMNLFVQNVETAIGYLPIKSINSNLRAIYEF